MDKPGARFLTVAICTHDPRRDQLERTLRSLREQDLPHDRWELLLVDNASTNGVCETMDLGWHPRGRLVKEPRIGLTMARVRVIDEAEGDPIMYVDDDNVLEPGYLTRVLRLVGEHPTLGVIGAGRLEPEFEEAPDPQLAPYIGMLALRTVDAPAWSNDPRDQVIPWGAGMAVRRVVAERYRELIATDPLRQRLDRSGASLNSGGDDEFSWVACEMGLGKGIFPELGLLHLIRASRVKQEYLLRLAEGIAFSHALLAHLHGRKVRKPKVQPSWKALLGRMARLRVGETLHEAHRLYDRRALSPVTRAFDDAYQRGVARFHATITG